MNSKKWSKSDRSNVRFLPVTATCAVFTEITQKRVESYNDTVLIH